MCVCGYEREKHTKREGVCERERERERGRGAKNHKILKLTTLSTGNQS